MCPHIMCVMKNITLSMDEKELEEARRYALARGISLNALIRELLRRTLGQRSGNWMDDCFGLMDQARVKADNIRWKREELYDV